MAAPARIQGASALLGLLFKGSNLTHVLRYRGTHKKTYKTEKIREVRWNQIKYNYRRRNVKNENTKRRNEQSEALI